MVGLCGDCEQQAYQHPCLSARDWDHTPCSPSSKAHTEGQSQRGRATPVANMQWLQCASVTPAGPLGARRRAGACHFRGAYRAGPHCLQDQSRADAELELAVLDTLTDGVLTACARAPEEVRRRLVGVLDGGITRPRARHIPDSAAGSRFPHACLRKLYVLCSRGMEAQGAHGCLLEVSNVLCPALCCPLGDV